MRIDIENKILIPIIILLLLSIITLGIVSYWSGYQSLLDNEIKNLSKNLEEMVFFIENTQENIETQGVSQEEAKAFVLDYFQRLGRDNLMIFEGENVLLSTFEEEQGWRGNLLGETFDDSQESLIIEDYIFTYQNYDEWNWTLGYRLSNGIFSYEVLENQKYMVLIAIVSLIFSMQAAIFISHNISKPIRMLADICDTIAQGNFHERIDIKRKDEIGMLANAFNNMLFRLQENTTKLLNITRLNEDILQNISSGIITTDQRGEILSINKTAKEFLKEKEEESIHKEIKDALLLQLRETIETNKSINHIHIFDNIQEGNKIFLDTTTSLLKTEGAPSSGAICNFSDISERRKIENNMETLDRLTSVGQLASGIAHEIRNPLAGMKTSIQVLSNRLCKEEETGSNKRLFTGVLHEIDRINDLITGILDFAKPRLPKYEKTDLLVVLNRELDLLRKTAEERKIEIHVLNNSSSTLVFVDKAQGEQIFLNIMKNAFHAMKEGGLLTIRFDSHREEGGCFLAIEFQDNGCGIELENIDKIFNPFFTTRHQGTGLGLSVVYELVKGNQGTIDVHSIVGQGTAFKIKFPIYGGDKDGKKNIDCR